MKLRVVVIRHAKPVDQPLDDDKKFLSEEGKVVQENIAHQLKNEYFQPDIIYTSPLLRAKQSAEVIASVMPCSIEERHSLGNNFDEKDLVELLKKLPEETTCFFVGHAPGLEKFVTLLTGQSFLDEGLPKSGAVVMDFDEEIAFGKAKLVKTFFP